METTFATNKSSAGAPAAPANRAKVGFLIVVGPGEGNIALDAIHAILDLYPEAFLWIRDDCTTDGTYEKLAAAAARNTYRIDLARNAKPLGLKGLPVSVFRSLSRVATSGVNLEMLIKVDPDVMITGSGIARFARARFAEAGPGIIGSYRLSATRAIRSNKTFFLRFLLDLFPAGFDRQHRRFRFGFPFYTRFLPRALRNGYRLGHHVLGAFYIVHGDTLRALERTGYLKAIPDMGSREMKWDDALLGIGPYFAGHRLIDLHDQENQAFWIQLKNPLSLSANEILTGGYEAVHPLKNDSTGRALRSQLATAAVTSASLSLHR